MLWAISLIMPQIVSLVGPEIVTTLSGHWSPSMFSRQSGFWLRNALARCPPLPIREPITLEETMKRWLQLPSWKEFSRTKPVLRPVFLSHLPMLKFFE